MDGVLRDRAQTPPPPQAMLTFEDDARVVRRNRLVRAVASAPLALGIALTCAGLTTADGAGLGFAVAWLGLGGFLYAWARNPTPSERCARVRADARGLFLDGKLAIGAPRVRAGWVQPRPHGPPIVHVSARRARDVELVVRDIERGRALLRALEVDAAQASAQFWTYARPLGEPRAFARAASLGGLVLAFGLVAGQSTPLALALAVVALFVLFSGVAVPTRVTVGADGVLLRWLGTQRFVAWPSVVAVEAFDGGVVLALDGGRWLTLRTPAAHERHHPERDAMVERMRTAWRPYAQHDAEEPTARLLRRAGARTAEWVRSMRGMLPGTSHEGYRVAAMPPERLWQLVENPRSDRAARTGAALALAPSLDEQGRERLRAAADACAEPRLRLALSTAATTAASGGSDEELAALLDAIESEAAMGADQEG
jgi:hypothetical protein